MGLRRDSVETGSFFSNWLAGVLWLTEACLPTAVVLRVALMIAAVVAEAFIGTALDCDRSGRIAFRGAETLSLTVRAVDRKGGSFAGVCPIGCSIGCSKVAGLTR